MSLSGLRSCPGLGKQGSIEHAVLQVESYRNVLENRVVSRFDTAAAAGDLSAMAQCARIMSQFRRGDAILMQVPPPPNPELTKKLR